MVANCTIIDSYLSDNLEGAIYISPQYTVDDWFNGSVDGGVTINNQNIRSPRDSSHWVPTFLSANNNIQKISSRGVYNKNCIGINDYVTFNPNFRNFSSDGYMSICWRLNSYDFPFSVTEGLMYWSRKTSIDEKIFSWDALANYIPFYTSGGLGPYIKLPENRVLDYTLGSNTSNIIENSAVKLATEILGKGYERETYRLYANSSSTELWIPDGDVFSYTDGQHATAGDKSFISPGLYQSYGAIYHSLTHDIPKTINGDARYNRRIKNLAKYLASSPLVSNFHIEAMKDLRVLSIRDQFANRQISLIDAISNISAELNSPSSDSDQNLNQDTGTINSGILTHANEVFHKLFSKYGAKLALKNDNKITLGNLNIENGDNIAITQISDLVSNEANSLGNIVTATQQFTTKNFTLASEIHNDLPGGDGLSNPNDLPEGGGLSNPNDLPEGDGLSNPYAKLNIISTTTGGVITENRIPLYDGIEPYWNSRLNVNIAMAYENTLDSGDSIKDGVPDDAPWSVLSNVFTFIPPPIPPFVNSRGVLVPPDGRTVPGNSAIDSNPSFGVILSDDPNLQADEVNTPVITLSAFNPILGFPVMTGKEDWVYFLASTEAINEFNCFWEHVSGPEVKFTDYKLSGANDRSLYNTSSSDVTNVLPSDYGAITVKCTVSGPFGVHVKYKTFIVETEDHKTAMHSYNSDMTKTRTVVNTSTLLDKYGSFFRAQRNPIPLNPRNRKVVAGSIAKVAFKAEGAVWPVSTNHKVIESSFQQASILPLSGPKFIFNATEDNSKIQANTTNTKGNIYGIKYNNNSDLIVYLDKIIVEKVRNGSYECSDCLSVFSNKIAAYERRAAGEGVTGNTLGYTNNYLGFSLADLPNILEVKRFGLNLFSTDNGSPLRYYGGYNSSESELSTNFHNELQLPDIPQGADGTYPAITGYPLNEMSQLAKDAKEQALRDAEQGIEPKPDLDPNGERIPVPPEYKLCYPKASDAIIGSRDSRDFYIDFKKGAFIPNSGWVSGTDINTSHVLKFNPGARESFAFNGPRMKINNNSIINNDAFNLINEPKIFTSTVSLGIGAGVRWDPLCECPPTQQGGSGADAFNKKKRFQNTQNQLHKEFADAYSARWKTVMIPGGTGQYESTHGYRMLAGGHPKDMERRVSENYEVNDEFFITQKERSSSDYETLYEFGVTGPANNLKDVSQDLLNAIRTGDITDESLNSDLELRDPKVNSFRIKDLEVNLRFFNYINTQDLVIWLEAELSADEIKNQQGRGKSVIKYPNLISPPSQFVDQAFKDTTWYQDSSIKWSDTDSHVVEQLDNYFSNQSIFQAIEEHVNSDDLKAYLTELTKINSTLPQKPFKLMLLNQEYVKNNQFNLSLKFSDHAEDNSSVNDKGYTKYQPVENFSSVKPTTAAMGYSAETHQKIDRLIHNHNLTIPCNTFSKFYDKSLFINPGPETGPCSERMPKQQGDSFDSQTKFSLKIAVINETDLMGPYDNVKSNVLYNNFTDINDKITSREKFNTLCTWEAVVHVDSEIKPIPRSNDSENYGSGSDIMGFIDYHTQPINRDSGYYGNSFIADLTGMLELMPLANINAPFQYIQNTSPCPDNSENPYKTTILPLVPPQFPTSAIIQILGHGAASGGYGFSSVGAAVVGANLQGADNGGYQKIYEFFAQTRKWAGADRKQGQIFALNHDGYQFGSGDKVLLNVSKDGGFWYNVEASIFRLANTPIMKNMMREVVPIYNSSTDLEILLSNFEYSIVSSKSELYEEEQDSIDELRSSIGQSYLIFDDNTYEANKCSYTVIKIESSIPYDLYEVGESMNIVDKTGNYIGSTPPAIIGKAKIVLDNKYVSIFALSDSKSDCTTSDRGSIVVENNVMSLDSSVIAIIDPVTSTANTLEEEEDVGSDPTSQFKFDGDINSSSYDDQWSSAKHPISPPKQNLFSRGSYGDTSLLYNKFFLNEIDKVNKVKKLYEIYNNRDNNKLKYNKIILYDNKTGSLSDTIRSKTKGFSCSINELLNLNEVFDDREEEEKKVITASSVVTVDTLDYVRDLFKNKYRDLKYKDKKHEIIYIKNQDFRDIYEEGLWSNYKLMFQGDMVVSNKVSLSSSTISAGRNEVIQRINVLDGGVADDKIPQILSNDQVSEFFKDFPSIATALAYYANFEDADDIPARMKLADNIEKLCAENNSLKRLLLQIAEDDVTSHVEAQVQVVQDPDVNVYEVDYSINNNLYWINIDPKQSCSISEELRPKVLYKTVTSCVFLDPTLQGQENLIDNNVCPQFAYGRGFSPGEEGVEEVEFGETPLETIDFRQTLPPTYKIPEETVEEQKKALEEKYPSIAGWGEYNIFRTFYMPTTQDITLDFSRNYIVFVREYYKIALPNTDVLPLEEAIDKGVIGNDYSGDVLDLPGIVTDDGACTLGSPGGVGLLASSNGEDEGMRLRAPTRVTNIFNLDNTENLRVKFRKIPRTLRGADYLATLYRYGDLGEYRQDKLVNPLQPIETTIGQGFLFNSPYFWQCYEYDENGNLQKTDTTKIMQILNELTYRAYMGSVDGAEHTGQGSVVSDYESFMVPYGYVGE